MASSTACFLHHVPSTGKAGLVQRPGQTVNKFVCRARKQTEEDVAVSRRLALTALVGVAAIGAIKVSPAEAAYGEAANVFGRPKKNTEFMPYTGDGFKLLIPSKWNKSKEVAEFPGQVLKYEDNFDVTSNLVVLVQPTSKKTITEYGPPEALLGQVDFLLGKQSYFGQTDSEGGFETGAVATANILESSTNEVGGKTYYTIEVLTRTADGDEGGKHHVIIATVSDGKLYICKAMAGDKRWFKGAKKFVEGAASSFNVA